MYSDRPETIWDWQKAVLSENGPANPNVRLVLLAIARYMDRDYFHCYPSQRKLAGDTSLTLKTVNKCVKYAAQEGWIDIDLGYGYKRGWRLNQYVATMPRFSSNLGEEETCSKC